MGKFEFRKQEIALDIAGVQTSVPNTVEYTERLKKAGEEMRAFGGKMKDEADLEKGIDTMLAILDDLLGEDVMDAIEAKRALDLYDCLDLVAYISEEVQRYHAARAEGYKVPAVPAISPNASAPMAQAAENRAARRARERAERRKK